MKSALKALAVAAFLFGSTGCVSVMKREAFQAPLHQSEESINSMKADLDAREAAYSSVIHKTSAPKSPPYPALGALLEQMRTAYAKLSLRKSRIIAMQKEFEDLSQGRPDISSDRPQWTPFLKLYDEEKLLLPAVNQENAAYTVPADQFSGLFNSAGITHFQTADIKGKLGASLTALDKGIVDIRAQVGAMKAKLNERAFLTLGLDQQKERRGIVDHILALTDQVESGGNALKGKVSAFEASIQGQTEIWQGPGFAKVEIIAQVTQAMDQINALTGQINADAAKWNAMNK